MREYIKWLSGETIANLRRRMALAVGSCAFGCARVEGNYIRGDYIVVHADAETSATLTVDASRTNPPSIWATIFGVIANLWR